MTSAQPHGYVETINGTQVYFEVHGTYAIAPTVNMRIMLADGQLTSQMTGQGKVPLFAESETMFFPQGVNAKIEFPKDGNGSASQLIVHRNGHDVQGKGLNDAEAKKGRL
jgi:hypothetical protein